MLWNAGDTITITAGTGAGKSYFIKNKLYEIASTQGKLILILVHRKSCLNQFESEISRDGKGKTIHVATYQKVQHQSMYKVQGIDLTQYSYIVCDEFHYFLDDSKFNNATDIGLEAILNLKQAVRVLMSATATNIKAYINYIMKVETIDYMGDTDFDHFKSLHFFYKEDTLEVLLKQTIKQRQKAIFFVQSVGIACRLHHLYPKETLFVCSQSNKHSRYMDTGKVQSMLQRERFEPLVLIATSALDTGASIIDADLHKIVIDMKDVNSLIQCIGRKRILDKNDTVDLYVRALSSSQINGMVGKIEKQIGMAEYLQEHGTQAWLEKYPKQIDWANIIYDEMAPDDDNKVLKRVNELKLTKKKIDLSNLKDMLRYDGYCNYLARKLGFYDEAGYAYRVLYEKYDLITYLQEHVGTILLNRADRKPLIGLVNLRRNGKLLKGIESINFALANEGLPYQVRQFQTSRIVDGKKVNYKSAWEIIEDKSALPTQMAV